MGYNFDELKKKGFNYDLISKIRPDFRKIVTLDQWKMFNTMMEKGKSFSEIAKRIKLTYFHVWALTTPRDCIIKYDDDEEKLRQCLEGKIDP